MAHCVAGEVEVDLDEIWLYVAKESGSMDVATRLVESITDRFSFLAGFPYAKQGCIDGFWMGRDTDRI